MKTLQEIKNIEKDFILETKHQSDPPMILLLRRKAIRLFPSGEKVALYHSDKLGMDISIPYGSHVGVAAGAVAEETLYEAEHDNVFGDYTEALKKHYETGAKHTDHPELSMLKQKVINKYGKEAHSHLHAAAEHMLNGDFPKASRRYAKFERTINEDYVEYLDEEVIEEAALHSLHHICKTKQAGTVRFRNGATARVEHPQAAHIMKLHSTVNAENKAKIEKLVNASPAGLSRVAEFAAANLK